VRPGTPLQLATKSGQSFGGVILGINKALAIGDVEIVVGVTNAGTRLKPGDFLAVTISVPRDDVVLTVPKSAVLRSAEGAYAYTLNGNAYYRTAIKLGAEAEGQFEVMDGLLGGDVVVTKAVEELWLIELRATRGGGHSH
jgi:multidrug efflux pump subunit AcrA (membrane-fusion protein)